MFAERGWGAEQVCLSGRCWREEGSGWPWDQYSPEGLLGTPVTGSTVLGQWRPPSLVVWRGEKACGEGGPPTKSEDESEHGLRGPVHGEQPGQQRGRGLGGRGPAGSSQWTLGVVWMSCGRWSWRLEGRKPGCCPVLLAWPHGQSRGCQSWRGHPEVTQSTMLGPGMRCLTWGCAGSPAAGSVLVL